VPVVVAKRDIAADERLRPEDLAVDQVPARFVPPGALGAPARLAGARPAVPVAAGAYLTAGILQSVSSDADAALRPGERAVEIAVGGGSGLALAGPGSRVDVLVSSQSHDGAGRTFVALEDVALLDLRPAAGGGPAAGGAARALATLRVTLRQAVYLTAAESFGREVRLLVRPLGDRRPAGAVAVAENQL
jgi:pilus assembly protein CpaB